MKASVLPRAQLLLVSALTFCSIALGADSFDAKAQVDKVFAALEKRDFEIVKALDFTVAENAELLRAETPTFLLTNKLEEFYRETSNSYSWNGALGRFASLRPEKKIVEVRETRYERFANLQVTSGSAHDVYVSLRFTSWSNAPFSNALNEDWGQPFTGKIIQESVVKMTFSLSGLFMGAQVLAEPEKHFAELPFGILALNIHENDFIDVYALGGQPPFKTKTVIGGRECETFGEIRQGALGIRISFSPDNFPFPKGLAGLKGSATITDAAGKKDVVSFTVPTLTDNASFLLKSPWANGQHWRNTELLRGKANVFALESTPENPKR